MQTKTITLENPQKSTLTAYLCSAPLAYNPAFTTRAVIICPGGGFMRLSPREAEPVALRFVAEGISAFVLEYPVGDEGVQFPIASRALALAVSHVRKNAAEYHVQPNAIAVCGFSAGGYVAASLAAGWNKPAIYSGLDIMPDDIRPNAAILCYPVIDLLLQRGYRENCYKNETADLTDTMRWRLLGKKESYTEEEHQKIALQNYVDGQTCPAFLWHTSDDKAVSAENSLAFAAALAAKEVPFEMHVYPNGRHGLALANDVTAAVNGDVNPLCAPWAPLAISWLCRTLPVADFNLPEC